MLKEISLSRLRVYLNGIDFPVTLIKDVFINEGDSEATQYLICSDLTTTYQQIITLYQRRWEGGRVPSVKEKQYGLVQIAYPCDEVTRESHFCQYCSFL